MTSIDLTDGEWQQVLGMLSLAPWRDANPLLMKIGQQLQARQQSAQHLADMPSNVAGNSAGIKVTPEMQAGAIKALSELKQ